MYDDFISLLTWAESEKQVRRSEKFLGSSAQVLRSPESIREEALLHRPLPFSLIINSKVRTCGRIKNFCALRNSSPAFGSFLTISQLP